eukprot:scaffold55214_cov30-Tisochrysis_lutea.AAC.2
MAGFVWPLAALERRHGIEYDGLLITVCARHRKECVATLSQADGHASLEASVAAGIRHFIDVTCPAPGREDPDPAVKQLAGRDEQFAHQLHITCRLPANAQLDELVHELLGQTRVLEFSIASRLVRQ